MTIFHFYRDIYYIVAKSRLSVVYVLNPHLYLYYDSALFFSEGKKCPILRSRITCLRDSEVLLVEVHEFHFVVRDLFLVGRLEHKGDHIGLVLRLDGDDVIIGRASVYIDQKYTITQQNVTRDVN